MRHNNGSWVLALKTMQTLGIWRCKECAISAEKGCKLPTKLGQEEALLVPPIEALETELLEHFGFHHETSMPENIPKNYMSRSILVLVFSPLFLFPHPISPFKNADIYLVPLFM